MENDPTREVAVNVAMLRIVFPTFTVANPEFPTHALMNP